MESEVELEMLAYWRKGLMHKREEGMYSKSKKEVLEAKKRAIDSLKLARRELKRCLDIGRFWNRGGSRLAKMLLVATERKIAHLSFANYREELEQIRHCEQEIYDRLEALTPLVNGECFRSDQVDFNEEIGLSACAEGVFLRPLRASKNGSTPETCAEMEKRGKLSFAKMTAKRVSYWKKRFKQHQANLDNMLSRETYVLHAQNDSKLRALVSKAKVKAAHFAKLKGQHNAYLAHLWNLLATRGHTGSDDAQKRRRLMSCHNELALLNGTISSMFNEARRNQQLAQSGLGVYGDRYVEFVERIYDHRSCPRGARASSIDIEPGRTANVAWAVTCLVHVRLALLHVKLYEAYTNWGDLIEVSRHNTTYPHRLLQPSQAQRDRLEAEMKELECGPVTITERLAHLKLLLTSMNGVPEFFMVQTDDLTVDELRWLDENLYMWNAEHPLYRETSIHIEQMLALYGEKSLKLGRT